MYAKFFKWILALVVAGLCGYGLALWQLMRAQ